jgi:hypothetical protein
MQFHTWDNQSTEVVSSEKAERTSSWGPLMVGAIYISYTVLYMIKFYLAAAKVRDLTKKLTEANAQTSAETTDKMNAVNNTYRFFVAGQRVATGKILKDKTILQVYPYQHGTGQRGILYKPPFQTLAEWQRDFETTSGRKIEYIEEEGRNRQWRHERIDDTGAATPPMKRPPFLEPVSPRTPNKVVDEEDEWEAVRSNAPDAPRNLNAEVAQRKKAIGDAIDALTKALEALKMA